MTHKLSKTNAFYELGEVFLTLSPNNQDTALSIIKALQFAQSSICPTKQPQNQICPEQSMRTKKEL